MPERSSSHLSPETLARLADLAEFYDQLSPEARAFFAELRKKDIERARKGLELISSLEATGRVLKWIILTFIGAVAAMVTLKDSLGKLASWWPLK